MPGFAWIKSFFKGHSKALSVSMSQNIKRVRAQVSKGTIREYFTELEHSMEGVEPKNIYNFEETNFTDDPCQEIIIKRTAKHADRCIDTSKSSTLVMMCGNANGEVIPPIC